MITNKPNNKKGNVSILNQSKKLYEMAIKELKEAKNGNWDKIIDAGEKAWGATSNACEIILRVGVKLLKRKMGSSFYTKRGNWIQKKGNRILNNIDFDMGKLRFLMHNCEKEESIYRNNTIYTIYSDNINILHGRSFYNGYINNKGQLENLINKTKEFIDFTEGFFNKH